MPGPARRASAALPPPPRAVRGGLELLRRAIRGPLPRNTWDFEGEGLLEGTVGEARSARIDLLQRLADDGFSLEALRAAIAEDRLALLPVERVLAGDAPKRSFRALCQEAGLDLKFGIDLWRSFGAAVGPVDDLTTNDTDLEVARAARRWLDAGVPEAGLLEIARAARHAMSTVAASMRGVLGAAFLRSEHSEFDIALRYAEVAEEAAVEVSRLLSYALRVHQRNQLALEVVGSYAANDEPLPGARRVAVSFADLVGFTALSETVYAPEVAEIAARLDRIGMEVAQPPVEFVKSLGDAVMLVSSDVDALIGACLRLNAAIEADDAMPALHIGIAYGDALPRAGDWFGQPVNVASRLAQLAGSGETLVTLNVREAAQGEYKWISRRRRVKGVGSRVQLFCVEAVGRG